MLDGKRTLLNGKERADSTPSDEAGRLIWIPLNGRIFFFRQGIAGLRRRDLLAVERPHKVTLQMRWCDYKGCTIDVGFSTAMQHGDEESRLSSDSVPVT